MTNRNWRILALASFSRSASLGVMPSPHSIGTLEAVVSQEVNPEKSWKEIADRLAHESDAEKVVALDARAADYSKRQHCGRHTKALQGR